MNKIEIVHKVNELKVRLDNMSNEIRFYQKACSDLLDIFESTGSVDIKTFELAKTMHRRSSELIDEKEPIIDLYKILINQLY